MSDKQPDPTDGWSLAEFGAAGGQMSKSVTELDDDFPAVPTDAPDDPDGGS